MIKYILPLVLAGLAAAVTVLIFALPTPATPSETPVSAAGSTGAVLIQNVRVVEAGQLSAPQSILLDDGLIAAVGVDLNAPAGAEIIDAEGATALPGLIDAHTHAFGPALTDQLRFGVTASLDMSADPSQLEVSRAAREAATQTREADLFSAGMMATVEGGHGTQFGIEMDTLSGPDEASGWVAARKAEGSDYIKMAYIPGQAGLPSLDRVTAAALIKASHKQGLIVVAHVSTERAAREVIEDGIDGLVHIFGDKDVSDEVVALAKEKDIFIIPTLTVISSVGQTSNIGALAKQDNVAPYLGALQRQTLGASFPVEWPGYDAGIAGRNVKRFHDAGVTILAGSDAPNPGTAHGISLHHELQLLVAAGLTPTEALAAATTEPARVFGLDGRGEIVAGGRADLVLVRGDPAQDIGATLNLEHIYKNGFAVSRELGSTVKAVAIESGVLADFESGLNGRADFGWQVSTDAMISGTSEASMERVAGGAGGSDYALQVTAKVKPGFIMPWAGAAFGTSTPQDLSRYSALRFDVKGTPGQYRLMAFGAGSMGIPPTTIFDITDEWREVKVPLSALAGFDPANFSGFAWVAGPEQGNSTFSLDNLELVQ